MRVYLALTFSLLLTTNLVAAPTTKKTSTQPSGETDGSGPRAALLLMDKVTIPGKPETALPFYHTTATRERVFANHLAEMDSALASLHKAATAKFGRDAADNLIKIVNGTTVADINAARITVDGSSAQVWFKDSSGPTEMVRVGDEWKISVKQWVRGVQNLPSLRSSLAKLATRVNDVAKGIEGGRHTSKEAAETDLRKAKDEAFPKAAAAAGEDDE
jgi:hypothetical protein